MVYLFLAEGFEEIEALTPVDVLRRGKVALTTVGVTGKTVVGSHGIPVTADITIDQLGNLSDADAVILPGGMPGTLNLEADKRVLSAVEYCFSNQKLIAAICAAPSIFGHMGLLSGKRAAAFPGFEKDLAGAVLNNEFVAHDGNVITAKGMGVSLDFALEILGALRGTEASAAVRSALQCKG